MWEFFSGELSSKKTDYITTQWIDYQDILRLTFLENTVYQNRYKQFLDLVLIKAINEINLKSDLEIEYEVKKEKGKLTYIRFIIGRKANPMIIHRPIIVETPTIMVKLQELGFPEKILEGIIKNNSEEQILNAIDFFIYTMQNQPDRIQNPIAFFQKTLKEAWVSPTIIQKKLLNRPQEEKLKNEKDIKLLIEAKEENITCKKIRYEIIKHIGDDYYHSWFDTTEFDIRNSSLILFSSKFINDWIESHYSSVLNEILVKFNLDKIEYITK